jgi:putative membrane protein
MNVPVQELQGSWFLAPSDHERVRRAIEELESRTAAEVLPLVVYQSSRYPQGFWRGLVFFGGIGQLMGLTGALIWTSWLGALGSVSGVLAGGLLGIGLWLVISRIAPSSLLTFTRRGEKLAATRDAAMAAFYRYGLADTRDESGLLFYISVQERQVRILVDRGVATRVPRERWDALARRTQGYLETGKRATALIEAIECMSAILGDSLPRRPDDVNELPDLVVLRSPEEWHLHEDDIHPTSRHHHTAP